MVMFSVFVCLMCISWLCIGFLLFGYCDYNGDLCFFCFRVCYVVCCC